MFEANGYSVQIKVIFSVIYSNETSCLHSINYSLPVKLGVLRPDRYHESKTFYGLESQMVMVNNPWIIIVLRNDAVDMLLKTFAISFQKCLVSQSALINTTCMSPFVDDIQFHGKESATVATYNPLIYFHNRRNIWSNKYHTNGSYLITTDRGRKSGSVFCVWELYKSVPKILSIPFFANIKGVCNN